MLPQGSALILITDPPQTRLAALVYRIPDGLGWLEPGYFDQFPPARSQWHTETGELTDTDNGLLLVGNRRILVLDVERVPELLDEETGPQLAYLGRRLAEMRTTLPEQRITLASELGASG